MRNVERDTYKFVREDGKSPRRAEEHTKVHAEVRSVLDVPCPSPNGEESF